jgi:hypothetical protein
MAKKSQIAEVQSEVQVETSVQDEAIRKLEAIKAIAADTSKSVSHRIRELAGHSQKMGDIVRLLTDAGYKTKNGTAIRFQHVRNVLKTEPKKG